MIEPGDAPTPSPGHRTWHLAPVAVWEAQCETDWYQPEGYPVDGFVHCTDDEWELIAVGNRYYQSDPRPFVALEIDCDALATPVRYEDPLRKFPHVFGHIETAAILRVLPVLRDATGAFVGLG